MTVRLTETERTRRWVAKISPGRIERWLKRRREERMLRQYGGLQTCPWCKQCAQDSNADWRFDPYPADMQLDVLTCGVCGGRSLWLWTIGMMYVRPLDHPLQKPLLHEVLGYIEGNHDEGCECDPDYGETAWEERMKAEDPDGDLAEEWPRDAKCTCGTNDLAERIRSALE